jgi:putative transposase
MPNHPVFITCVTCARKPILANKGEIELFWQVVQQTQERHPFTIIAYVILTDHFHWLLELPENQPNFSTAMQHFKMEVHDGIPKDPRS